MTSKNKEILSILVVSGGKCVGSPTRVSMLVFKALAILMIESIFGLLLVSRNMLLIKFLESPDFFSNFPQLIFCSSSIFVRFCFNVFIFDVNLCIFASKKC